MKLDFELTLKTFAYEIHKLYRLYAFFVHKIERMFVPIVVDKTKLAVSRLLGPFLEFLRGKME